MAATTMVEDILSGVGMRTDYALSLIDPNRTDPNAPGSRLNLRDSIRACLQIREYLAETLRFAWSDVAQGRINDYDRTGKIIVLGFEYALKTIRAVLRAVDSSISEGRFGAIDGHFEEVVAKFRETIPALEQSRDDFQTRWPWLDETRLQESVEADRQNAPRKVAPDAFREIRSRIQGVGH
jgi:hypothetical protein